MHSRFVGSAVLVLAVVPVAAGAPLAASGHAAPRRDRGLILFLDAGRGEQLARVAANGVVDAAVADGRGGWFVGGSFTRLGHRRHIGIAHVLRGCAVDESWQGSVGSVSGRAVSVQALARAGTRLYLAGAFARVGGLHRPGLGALDTDSGSGIRGWRPRPLLWLDVGALLATGPRLLVAGQFSYPTAGISALDARTGAIDPGWNPHLRVIGDAGSFSTLLRHDGRVYVAGSFRVAGLRRNGLVALNPRSGRPDTRWAPRAQNCPVCNHFAVLYGLAASRSRLYVSGAFARIDGAARDGLAALDPGSGALIRRWQPARGGHDILHLTLSNDRLYAGGASGLFALRATTGARVQLPSLKTPQQVLALTTSGKELLVAGRP